MEKMRAEFAAKFEPDDVDFLLETERDQWSLHDTATYLDLGTADAATHDIVQDYYGRQLQSTTDLKTSACCDTSAMPEWLKPLLCNIHPEVLSRYYGCGLVCPPLLEGCRVDLGVLSASEYKDALEQITRFLETLLRKCRN